MTARDIIEELARNRTVETIVWKVCRSDAPEIKDLAQHVYEQLLTYREECIVDLYTGGRAQVEAFVARVVERQYFEPRRFFDTTFRQYRRRCISMDACGYEDEEEEGDAY